MAKFTANGQEFELDLADADMAEKAQAAIQRAQDEAGKKQQELQENKDLGKSIRAICAVIDDCFDNIFGEGTAEKLFGGKTNMLVSIDVFAALCDEVKRQTEEIGKHTNSIIARYNPNRAARRHPEKK